MSKQEQKNMIQSVERRQRQHKHKHVIMAYMKKWSVASCEILTDNVRKIT